jgi:hypothetical protein
VAIHISHIPYHHKSKVVAAASSVKASVLQAQVPISSCSTSSSTSQSPPKASTPSVFAAFSYTQVRPRRAQHVRPRLWAAQPSLWKQASSRARLQSSSQPCMFYVLASIHHDWLLWKLLRRQAARRSSVQASGLYAWRKRARQDNRALRVQSLVNRVLCRTSWTRCMTLSFLILH